MSIDKNEQYNKYLEDLKRCLDELKQYHALEQRVNVSAIHMIKKLMPRYVRLKVIASLRNAKTEMKGYLKLQ